MLLDESIRNVGYLLLRPLVGLFASSSSSSLLSQLFPLSSFFFFLLLLAPRYSIDNDSFVFFPASVYIISLFLSLSFTHTSFLSPQLSFFLFLFCFVLLFFFCYLSCHYCLVESKCLSSSLSVSVHISHAVNGPIAAETGSQGRCNVGSLLQMVHEARTLAHERVEFVAGRDGLVQRDPAQPHAAWHALIQNPSPW